MVDEDKKKILDLFPTRYWDPLKRIVLLEWFKATPDRVYNENKYEVYMLKDDGEVEVSFEKVSSSYTLDKIQSILGLTAKKGISIYIPRDLSRKKVSRLRNSVKRVASLKEEERPFVIADEKKGIVEIYGRVDTCNTEESKETREPFKAIFCLEPRRLIGFLDYRGRTIERDVLLEDLFTEEELERIDKEGIRFSVASSPSRGRRS